MNDFKCHPINNSQTYVDFSDVRNGWNIYCTTWQKVLPFLQFEVCCYIKDQECNFKLWLNKLESRTKAWHYDRNQQTWISCFTCKLGNRNSPDLRIYEKQNLDLIPFPLPSIKACDDFSVDLKIRCY